MFVLVICHLQYDKPFTRRMGTTHGLSELFNQTLQKTLCQVFKDNNNTRIQINVFVCLFLFLLSAICSMTNHYKENGNYTWFVGFNQTMQKTLSEVFKDNNNKRIKINVFVCLFLFLLSAICSMTNHYKENGNYTWFVSFNQTLQKTLCKLVPGNTPRNAYLRKF